MALLTNDEIKEIYSGAIIESGARIYSGAIIESGAIIYSGAIIESGAKIYSGARIKKIHIGIILSGYYKYNAGAYWDFRDETNPQPIVRLGCHYRTIEEWDNDFDNNIEEFPVGSPERQARLDTYLILKNWLLNHKPAEVV